MTAQSDSFFLSGDGNFGRTTRNELRTRVRLPDVMLALISAMDTELERQVAQESARRNKALNAENLRLLVQIHRIQGLENLKHNGS